MYNMHRTKSGETMFISMMEDDHLQNTINMYVNKIRSQKELLGAKVNISPMKMAMYGVDTARLVEAAKKSIKACCTKLYPYLAEAMLRGFDYKVQLQEIFERTSAEPKFDLEMEPASKGRYITATVVEDEDY